MAFNKTWTKPCPHEAFRLLQMKASSLHLVPFCVAFHWKSANNRGDLLQRQRKELALGPWLWWLPAWFQIGKGVHQGCVLSACLFNFYAKDIMRNAGLEEAQAGIKIAGRNINNLRYADDTTLTAESEELKSLWRKVREESEKVGLQLNIQNSRPWHLVP